MADRKPRLLVVEDERPHQLIVSKCLTGFYDFDFAASVAEAVARAEQCPYDLILLDIMLPDGTGFDVLAKIRTLESHRLTPVIFLTVREDIKSKLMGFSLGGDDYLVKPPEALELRARIDAKLRKMFEIQGSASVLKVGDMSLDTERQAVWVDEGSGRQALDLTPLEFRLLLFFAKHQDQPQSRTTILQSVWGDATHVLDRSVDSYVAALRRKLGARGKLIKSVHGVGYKLTTSTPGAKKAA